MQEGKVSLCSQCGRPIRPAWVHEGIGTALKPAMEIICLARKPLVGTVAANVARFGTGGLNVDASRIGTADHWEATGHRSALGTALAGSADGSLNVSVSSTHPLGRWPANVLLDEEAAELLDAQTGTLVSNSGKPQHNRRNAQDGEGIYGNGKGLWEHAGDAGWLYGDQGGASRFFYVAKASRAERDRGLGELPDSFLATMGDGIGEREHNESEPRAWVKNNHPTVKPQKLCEWLIRLVTPPGGTVLDPFLGSGTTGVAAVGLGFDFIGIEREPDYHKIAIRRLAYAYARACDDRADPLWRDAVP